ncbi:unnamed protein product [Lactuca saligna]|uniref:Uncharacterized protein n=1 Tax=Lactuca saligna TaxID=75948 RepID=A0AA36E1Y2_LACSI|nr:unnamed protein product [Lactuca saligna]
MKSTHKRKSSSQKLVRKPQITHQGVLIRGVPASVSPGSKKRVAEDMAKQLSQPKKKKLKKTRKLVLSTESTDEDERIPETLEFTPIVTSSIPETNVIKTPEVSIAKSIFEEVRTSGIPSHVSDTDANVNMGEGGSKDGTQGIFLPREEKKLKKSKKVVPTSPEPKKKGSKTSKSSKKQTENVEVTIDETNVVEPMVDETQENVIIPSKTGMFRRIKMKSTHKRKSSSQKLVRKPQITHQGILIRGVPAPVSLGSKKRVAEDMAKQSSQPKKKKLKKTRKLVLSTESTDEDERIPETLEFTPIVTSSIPETNVIKTPEVSIAKSIFEEPGCVFTAREYLVFLTSWHNLGDHDPILVITAQESLQIMKNQG